MTKKDLRELERGDEISCTCCDPPVVCVCCGRSDHGLLLFRETGGWGVISSKGEALLLATYEVTKREKVVCETFEL